MWITPRKCKPAMMMTTPAILLSSGEISATRSWPATVAVAPRMTNTVVKPSTKATDDSTTVA